MHGVHFDEHDAARAKATRPRPPTDAGQARGGGATPLLTLQQAAGNRAVASMIGGVHRTVQRCGPGSDCGCSAEQRAQHAMAHPEAADQPMQRSADGEHELEHGNEG